jgi:alpha-mannosidase
MDENMPDGESLVRQFLYGQKATKQRFGHYVRVAWQPNVFGHPWSMPQIARKAGLNFFSLTGRTIPSGHPLSGGKDWTAAAFWPTRRLTSTSAQLITGGLPK